MKLLLGEDDQHVGGGPLLKRFNLSVLKLETSLIGIVDAHAFRSEILQRREAMKQRSEHSDRNIRTTTIFGALIRAQ